MKELEIRKIERDENGLIKGIEYVLDEYGKIDLRKTLPKKFFYVKDPDLQGEDIDNLPDNKLLIYLAGFKWLAKVRGYNSIKYPTIKAGVDFCSMSCEISWIGNFETEGRELVHTSTADATLDNTDDFMGTYLTTCAENRSFSRAVRTFLEINVCGKDEIAPENSSNKLKAKKQAKKEYGSSNIVQMIEDCMSKLGYGFSFVLNQLKEEGEVFETEPQNLNELHSQKPTLSVKLLARLKKKMKK